MVGIGKKKVRCSEVEHRDKLKSSTALRTSKRTQHSTIIKINWLTLFKEITAVYKENHMKPVNTKYKITDFKADCIYIFYY
jgi:hypothetical protein